MEERKGVEGETVVLVELEDDRDKQNVMQGGGKIKRKWDVGIDEDLAMEERRMKWRLVEKARVERRKRKRVEIDIFG